PGRGRGQHEEVRRVHPGHPRRSPHGRVPRLRHHPHHVRGLHLPRARRTAADAGPHRARREHQHPVRRLLDHHRRRRRPGDGQADQLPAAAAPLRRVPPLSNATDGQSASRPARLVMMGPQGAGKGTQAARLAEQLSIPAISTGDIFRANIKGGTELGRLAQEYTAKGELVPDSVTNAMVRDRLAQDDAAQGFILDGYPRNAAQVVELDAILADLGVALDGVVELTADRDELLARLAKRAEIEGREDDTEEAIARRLDIYAEQTAPLTSAYDERGLLVRVDGIGDIDEVTGRIVSALTALVG